MLKGHVVNTNDFVRTSLDLDDESETACRNLKIAVKTIEPQELKKHPEWIDYADLLYIRKHQLVPSRIYGVMQIWISIIEIKMYLESHIIRIRIRLSLKRMER